MDSIECLPNIDLKQGKTVSDIFLSINIKSIKSAAYYLKRLNYGYNSEIDNPLILFKENRGNCTTKHAVFALLAGEYGLPVYKTVGIYKLTEKIVTGINHILTKYNIPYLPFTHCFLTYKKLKIDLTEGNCSGKKRRIEDYIFSKKVKPLITAIEEYSIYLKAAANLLIKDGQFNHVKIGDILNAKEEASKILREKAVCLLRN